MWKTLPLVVLFVLLGYAQQSRGFDVASVRQLDKETLRLPNGQIFRTSPASVTATGTLGFLIIRAYSLQSGSSITGLPAWAHSVFYDLKAKTETPRPEEEIRSMLRTLLAERFSLKAHWQERDLSYYALVVGESGPKLKPLDPDAEQQPKPQHDRFHLRNTKQVADFLASWMHAPVVDETRISGDFDMTIEVSQISLREATGGSLGRADPTSYGEVLAREVREHLGLKLERRKGPVEILVIDRALPPSEN